MPQIPRKYSSARGFSAALRAAIKARQAGSDRTYNELAREFYLQRFLARVFAEPGNRWVLKGGTSLLTRHPDLARYSQDIDLLYRGGGQNGLTAAAAELRRVAGANPELDQFTFTVRTAGAITGGAGGMRLTVVASFGATDLERFPIDLVADLPLTAQVDQYDPKPVIEFEAVGALPAFTLYPLPDQVADKVCAMYERHGSGSAPSSRYRDLIDLLIIVGNNSLDATSLDDALRREATRRSLELPLQLVSPAPAWTNGYAEKARSSTLPKHLHNLDEALATAAACLDPILSRAVTTGQWNPATRRWEPRSDDDPP